MRTILKIVTDYQVVNKEMQTQNNVPISLDQSLDSDNKLRLIDLFVDSLTIAHFGFKTTFIKF